MAGSFAPTPELRAIAWGIDGTSIIVGCALLAVIISAGAMFS
jgi:hypothetical protein